jgi:hypothetical protein
MGNSKKSYGLIFLLTFTPIYAIKAFMTINNFSAMAYLQDEVNKRVAERLPEYLLTMPSEEANFIEFVEKHIYYYAHQYRKAMCDDILYDQFGLKVRLTFLRNCSIGAFPHMSDNIKIRVNGDREAEISYWHTYEYIDGEWVSVKKPLSGEYCYEIDGIHYTTNKTLHELYLEAKKRAVNV